jgi:hypothetical protein
VKRGEGIGEGRTGGRDIESSPVDLAVLAMFILYTSQATCISLWMIVPLLISYNPNDWAAPHFLSTSFGMEPGIIAQTDGVRHSSDCPPWYTTFEDRTQT